METAYFIGHIWEIIIFKGKTVKDLSDEMFWTVFEVLPIFLKIDKTIKKKKTFSAGKMSSLFTLWYVAYTH